MCLADHDGGDVREQRVERLLEVGDVVGAGRGLRVGVRDGRVRGHWARGCRHGSVRGSGFGKGDVRNLGRGCGGRVLYGAQLRRIEIDAGLGQPLFVVLSPVSLTGETASPFVLFCTGDCADLFCTLLACDGLACADFLPRIALPAAAPPRRFGNVGMATVGAPFDLSASPTAAPPWHAVSRKSRCRRTTPFHRRPQSHRRSLMRWVALLCSFPRCLPRCRFSRLRFPRHCFSLCSVRLHSSWPRRTEPCCRTTGRSCPTTPSCRTVAWRRRVRCSRSS